MVFAPVRPFHRPERNIPFVRYLLKKSMLFRIKGSGVYVKGKHAELPAATKNGSCAP